MKYGPWTRSQSLCRLFSNSKTCLYTFNLINRWGRRGAYETKLKSTEEKKLCFCLHLKLNPAGPPDSSRFTWTDSRLWPPQDNSRTEIRKSTEIPDKGQVSLSFYFKTSSEKGNWWRPGGSAECRQKLTRTWTHRRNCSSNGNHQDWKPSDQVQNQFLEMSWIESLERKHLEEKKKKSGELHHMSRVHKPADGLTSTMSRLVSPRQTGRIQVESGNVRSGNHRVPPAARSPCSATQTQGWEPSTRTDLDQSSAVMAQVTMATGRWWFSIVI